MNDGDISIKEAIRLLLLRNQHHKITGLKAAGIHKDTLSMMMSKLTNYNKDWKMPGSIRGHFAPQLNENFRSGKMWRDKEKSLNFGFTTTDGQILKIGRDPRFGSFTLSTIFAYPTDATEITVEIINEFN